MPADDIIARISELADTADRERREERVFAASNSIAHYLFGALGVVGGAVAAATASDGPTWVTVVAGIVAAVGSGLATFFKFEDTARKRFGKERRYKSVVEFARNEHARLHSSPNEAQATAALADVQARLDAVRGAIEH